MLQSFLQTPASAPALAEGFAAAVGAPVSADLADARAALARAEAAYADGLDAADAARQAVSSERVLQRWLQGHVDDLGRWLIECQWERDVSAEALREHLDEARQTATRICDDDDVLDAAVEWVRAEAALEALRLDVCGSLLAVEEAEEALADA